MNGFETFLLLTEWTIDEHWRPHNSHWGEFLNVNFLGKTYN